MNILSFDCVPRIAAEIFDFGAIRISKHLARVERKGFKVCELVLDANLDGFSANAAGRPLVVLGQIDNKPRKRMTVCMRLRILFCRCRMTKNWKSQ